MIQLKFFGPQERICVRSKYFEEINGFDEDFFAHQEEIDLCWRFK